MSRLDEIRSRCDAGRPIPRIDVKWMLAEIAQLTTRVEKAEANAGHLVNQAEEYKHKFNAALVRAEKVEAEISVLRTPKQAVAIKMDTVVQIGHVRFGRGCTVHKCPCCGTFLTPTHKILLRVWTGRKLSRTAERRMSMESTRADGLSYPDIKADLERCSKQLHAICAGTHDGTAVMSVPPQPTDFDMQFSAAFDELAAYRAIGTVEHIQQLAEAEKDGRCIILPTRNDEIVHAIEVALRIKLYDWQKAYIFGASDYLMSGRATGKTTAHMLKLLLNEGPPLHLYNLKAISEVCDEYHGTQYYHWFRSYLRDMYYKLSNPELKLKIRKIYFSERKSDNAASAETKE